MMDRASNGGEVEEGSVLSWGASTRGRGAPM